jgi:carboxyl-terminal processing protease
MVKKIKLSALRNFVIGLLLLVLGGTVGYRYAQSGGVDSNIPLSQVFNTEVPANKKKEVDFGVFWEVWNSLDQTYLYPEELDAKKLVGGAIQGLTRAVGDPYTAYLPPQQNQRSAEDLSGSFYGVGIELGYIDETLAVVAPLNGTPAEAAGIQAGDLILHVADPTKDLDEDTTNWTLNEAVEKIRGKKGVPVTLTLLRKDEEDQYGEPFQVEIERGEIVVKTVELEFVEEADKRVAHLKVTRFGERTAGEFDQAVVEILGQGYELDGILLDFRNNPGGFFDVAIDLASEFIEEGNVVTQKGRFTERNFEAEGSARLRNFPVLVLVNRGSASASEIVAGALRDQLGAKLVGEKTFGKGTVQDRHELSNGGGLHVTIARWLLPGGDWINEDGIPVSVEVKDDPETEEDEVLQRAIQEL